MNDEVEINDLLYKTIITSDKEKLTDEDVNNIHKQLKNLKNLKEEQEKKNNKKEFIKDVFTSLFHLIYMGMILFNVLMIIALTTTKYKCELGAGDLVTLLIETTLTAIFIEYIYFSTESKIDAFKELNDK